MPEHRERLTHRERGFVILRIAFGCVWLIDAYLKWTPAFLDNLMNYFMTMGQPAAAGWWIHLWMNIIAISPYTFAVIIALAETALAVSLISGILSKQAMYAGIVLSFLIWSTAEGFGGPYVAGSTDIGASVIYIFVFVALLIGLPTASPPSPFQKHHSR